MAQTDWRSRVAIIIADSDVGMAVDDFNNGGGGNCYGFYDIILGLALLDQETSGRKRYSPDTSYNGCVSRVKVQQIRG